MPAKSTKKAIAKKRPKFDRIHRVLSSFQDRFNEQELNGDWLKELADKHKIAVDDIKHYAAAYRLAGSDPLRLPIIYAVFKQGVAKDLAELQQLQPQKLGEVLNIAVDAGDIKLPVPKKLAKAEFSRWRNGTTPLPLLAKELGIALNAEVEQALNDRGIQTLSDIIDKGGLSKMAGLEAIKPALLAKLDAHANLSLLQPDLATNNQLIGKGYKHIFDIANASEQRFVASLKDSVKEDLASQLHQGAQQQIAFLNNLEIQKRVDIANGIKPFQALAGSSSEPCECKDCDAAVSPRAYLADLMNYAVKHVTYQGNYQDLQFFTNHFYQPFSDLPADCSAIDTEVRQVRIAVEVLRSLPYTRDPAFQAKIKDTEKQYLLNAYQALLIKAGTNYTEIRLARSLDNKDSEKINLAERISIPVDKVDDLFVSPDQLTEDKLEKLFGLADTTKPPLKKRPTAQLVDWRQKTLRKEWLKRDGIYDSFYPTDEDGKINLSRRAVIDPDIIGPDDFRNPTYRPGLPRPNTAFELWVYRRQWVDDLLAALKGIAQKTDADGNQGPDLEGMITQVMATTSYHNPAPNGFWQGTPADTYSFFKEQLEAYTNAQDADASKKVSDKVWAEYHLPMPAVQRLMELWKKDKDYWIAPKLNEALKPEEWAELHNILVLAHKEWWQDYHVNAAAKIGTWQLEEQEMGILLSAEHFWSPLQNPRPGNFPLQRLPDIPLLDPEKVKSEDLPGPVVGKAAKELLDERIEALKKLEKKFANDFESSEDFEQLVVDALGQVPEEANWFEYFKKLEAELDGNDPDKAKESKDFIGKLFQKGEDDFRRLLKSFKIHNDFLSNKAEKPALRPAEIKDSVLILLSAYKQHTLYPEWYREENGLESWECGRHFLPAWRAEAEARQIWTQALRERAAYPSIDPDVIRGNYLKNPVPGDAVYDLWQKRSQDLQVEFDQRLAMLKTLAAFDARCNQDLGTGILAELAETAKEGKRISDRLTQLNLSRRSFNELIRLRAILLKSKPGAALPILDEEWENMASILTQIWKKKQFISWKLEEQAQKLIIGPDYFKIPEIDLSVYPVTQPIPLDPWRVDAGQWEDWLDRLSSRIEQNDNIPSLQKKQVGEVEELTLPALRDGILRSDLGVGAPSRDPIKWLGDYLGIALTYDGKAITTRIAQAIETFQILLWGLRIGTLQDIYRDLKLDNNPGTFDEEWKWMGSYASWRAAMFVFLYPENIIVPSLRRYQSPGFQELVTNFRKKRNISARDVQNYTEAYYGYFNDVLNLNLSGDLFWCISKVLTNIHSGEKGIDTIKTKHDASFYWSVTKNTSNKLYWSVSLDPKKPINPNYDSNYAQSYWHELSVFKLPISSLLGATVYEIPGKGRHLFLFAITKDIEKTQIEYAKLNLETGVWDTEATPLDLPPKVKDFSPSLLKNGESEVPTVEIEVTEQEIYRRPLGAKGDGWATQDFSQTIVKGHWENIGDPIPSSYDVNLLCDGSGLEARFILAGDFDGDGQDEILVAKNSPAKNDFWCRKYQNGQWVNLPDLTVVNSLSQPTLVHQAWIGDFNGDRKVEVLTLTDVVVSPLVRSPRRQFSLYALNNQQWDNILNFDNGLPVDSAIVGKFSSQHANDELLVKRDGRGTLGNDFNFGQYSPGAWNGLLYLDCEGDSTSPLFHIEAHFAIKGDFDGDGQDEVAICQRSAFDGVSPYVNTSLGNDFWMRKFKNVDEGWSPMGFTPEGVGQYQYDCDGDGIPAAFAVTGDFDGDKKAEIMVFSAIKEDKSTPDVFSQKVWAMQFEKKGSLDPPNYGGVWNPMPAINLPFQVASAVAADFDGDGRDEVAIFAYNNDSLGNDGYIFKFYEKLNTWKEFPALDFSGAAIAASALIKGKFSRKKEQNEKEWREIAAMPCVQSQSYLMANYGHGGPLYPLNRNPPTFDDPLRFPSDKDFSTYFSINYKIQSNGIWVRRFVKEGDAKIAKSCDTTNIKPNVPGPDPNAFYTLNITSTSGNAALTTDFQAFYNSNTTNSARNISYIEEAFYFLPIHTALQLQKSGAFKEALDWFSLVYEYFSPPPPGVLARPWPDDPNTSDDYVRKVEDWLLDPLNPHAIAKTRYQAYTRFTLLSIIKCLLDYADSEFSYDTPESVPQARELYEQAHDLLNVPELRQSLPGCEAVIGELNIVINDKRQVWVRDEIHRVVRKLEDEEARRKVIGVANAEFAAAKPKDPVAILQLVNKEVEKLKAKVTTYQALQRSSTETRPEMYTAGISEHAKEIVQFSLSMAGPPSNQSGLSLLHSVFDFCIPPNPVLRALRMRTSINLHKIDTNRNIAGVQRQLEFYAAATDTKSGSPRIDADGRLSLPGTVRLQPTPYRYAVIIERAKQLTQIANQIESSFLNALEKRDKEALDILNARQNIQTARANIRLQDLRVNEAKDGVKLSELQKQRAQIQVDTLESWIVEDLLELEEKLLSWYKTIADYQQASIGVSGAINAMDIGLRAASMGPTGILYGVLGGALSVAKNAIDGAINNAQKEMNVLSLNISNQLRKREWQFQKSLAEQDLVIGDQQIKLANDRVQIVEQERTIEQLKADNAKEVFDFLSTKFTNLELYDWMSDVLEGVYSYFLQQATSVAKLATYQLAFELQESPSSYIQNDYWKLLEGDEALSPDSTAPDRKGMTGSARLLQDIYQLDQYAFGKNSRKQQLTKVISLAQHDPLVFQSFKESGVLPFALGLDLFDRDSPGEYLRLIKRVRTSVIALVPTIQGIKATLTSNGLSRVVIGGDIFQTVLIRRDPELISLSSPYNATGLFDLQDQLASEMLLPFEYLGVANSWEFKMPKAANSLDYSTIADVLISIDYTALYSFDYHQQVIKQLEDRRNVSAYRAFGFRNEFADAWYDLHNPEFSAKPMEVEFETRLADFPPNLESVKIEDVSLYFSRKGDESFELTNVNLFFTQSGENSQLGGGGNSEKGIINSARAGKWKAFQDKIPNGKWKLVFTDSEEIRNYFKDNVIEDILFVVTYKGRYPQWV